jgi:SAM-dependent methyltransferase
VRTELEMSSTVYDEHFSFYLDFVDKSLAAEDGHLAVLMSMFTSVLGKRLLGARVLDLACGEGYLGRHLAATGAREVIGIDISAALVAEATRRSDSPTLTYRVDDAHELATMPDASVDIVVSQLALMDIADHKRTFRAVRRVLASPGVFVFSVLHPCFDGSPFHWPDEPKYVLDARGSPKALVVRRYATEGHWRSDGTGVRGRVGSHHRTGSTYVNDVMANGFRIEQVLEPVLPHVTDRGPEGTRESLFTEIPLALFIAAQVSERRE